jgi:hypothetical protein
MTNREITVVTTLAQAVFIAPMLIVSINGLNLDQNGLASREGAGAFVMLAIQLHISNVLRDWMVQQLSKRQTSKSDLPIDRISN